MGKTLVIPLNIPITDRAAINTIENYIDDFKQFGDVVIANNKPKKGSKGGRPRKVIYLNEEQVNLLFMYRDNNLGNRQHKINLVLKLKNLENIIKWRIDVEK